MDPLAQFKQGQNIDKPKSELDISKDKEYGAPLKVSLETQKSELKDSLYGRKKEIDFSDPFGEHKDDKSQESEKKDPDKERLNETFGDDSEMNKKSQLDNFEQNEEIDLTEKIEEDPNTPLIDSFVKQGLLTVEEGEIIKGELIKRGDIEEKLKDVEGVDSQKITQVIDSINYLNGEEAQKQGQDKFNKDFSSEIENLKKPVDGGKKGEKELSGQENAMIEKLGGNYFSLKGVEGSSESQKEALSKAFKTTLNRLMDGKQFKRPEDFDKMKSIVNDPDVDFNTRFKELLKINNLIVDDQSRANGKQATAFRKDYIKGKEAKKQTLEERFNNLKQEIEIAQKREQSQALDELVIQATDLKEESEASGDIFVAGDIDMLLKDLKNENSEQKEEA